MRRSGAWLIFTLATSALGCGRVPAEPIPSVPPASEPVSGSTRMTGGPYVVDVQVGHAVQQTRATGGDISAEGAVILRR
jgi:hypothetical protein